MFTSKGKSLFTIVLFLLAHSFCTSAQTNNPLINSGEIITNAATLRTEKKYKEAIVEYKKINRSDTNYVNALYEISYSYYLDSQFDKSLEYAKKGMELFPYKYSLFSLLAANSIIDSSRKNESMAIFDSALQRNPNAFLLHFNKGVINYNQKNYEEAKKDFQKTVMINPFYSNAHYYLANIYLFEGNLIPALLAYKTYLLISPEGMYYSNAINGLNSIAKVTDEVLEYTKNRKKSKKDDFSMLQDILLSKVALDKQYKLKADLEDNIVRQIQVVDEKLEYNKNDNGFVMQYYVPFYINTLKDGYFEAMIFTIVSGVNNKIITDWNKKNKKERQAFIDKASAYFDAIKSTQILDLTQRESSALHHIYNEKNLLAKGAYSNGKDPHVVGKWEYFYDNGQLKATGNYDDKGEKEGMWFYYYENGILKEKTKTAAGLADGLSEGWFDNGNKWYVETYANGKINGLQTIYYYNEKLRSLTYYKDDLKNGEQRNFDTKGILTSVPQYSAGKLNGISKTYYSDGKLKSEVGYKDDKEEGTYKSYYKSGALYSQGEYKNGLAQGLWTNYYEDGVIADKTVYLDNEITGEFTEYYANGKLKRKGTYYKKKLDGKLESYDDDGKLFNDDIYDRGKLKELNFYDKSGNIISTTTTRKGAANIVFYSPEGIKTSEGFFNKDGNKDGKFVSYYNSGKVSEESNWKDGIKEGPQVNYYSNGKIRKETTYKDGEEEGYAKEYFANGVVNSEGWKTEGNRQQHYIFYNNAGDLTVKEYYLHEQLNGYSENFYPKNILNIEYLYKNGWIENIKQFDTLGKVISETKLNKGKGPLVYKYFNGKNSVVGNYENYMQHGPLTYYFFDGSLSATGFYKTDMRDSIYKGYYYGGAVRVEGKYKDGLKEGVWKYYYPNGKLKEEENYVADNLQGLNTLYMPDGSLDKIISYKNNEFDGPYNIYGDKDQLAVRFNYEEDVVQSYQYEEKPGVLIAPILLKGSSGKVTAKYPNGKTSASLTFSDNSGEGERKIYYSNGNIFVDGKRTNGYNDGLVKVYYPNGTLWKEENYILGGLHGIARYYSPDGKLLKEENYYNNDNHGVNKYYDDNGKLKQTRIYYYGLLTGVK